MYAAAGGASLAHRQARRNLKKQASSGDAHAHHPQNKFRPPPNTLPPLQIRHLPPPTPAISRQPSHTALSRGRPPTPSPVPTPSTAAPGPHDDRSRPPSYCELNGRVASFGSADASPEARMTTVASSMQAALYVREKQKQRKKKIHRGRLELPSNVATKEIAPFPRYPPIQWCSQGKAAWQERDRERRVSLTEVAVNHRIKATEAHRRWMKRNRIHDSSFGGSSSDDEDEALYGHQSEAANALLYVGLGTVAIGLVISFVGTGEKGFKTLELRLIGPSLIGSGLLCCLVRIFLCVCPSRCLRRNRHRHRHKKPTPPHYRPPAAEDIALADQTSLLVKNSKKAVSIVTSSAPVPSGSSSSNQNENKHQIQTNSIVATTTLFLQHEKERASSAYARELPSINFVSNNSDDEGGSTSRRQPPSSEKNLLDLELQQLDAASFDICSFDSSNSPEKSIILNDNDSEASRSIKSASRRDKMKKPRAPANARTVTATPKSRLGLVNPDPEAHKLEEDMLLADEVVAEIDKHSADSTSPAPRPTASSPHHSEKDDLLQNELVLSPAKLQQDIKDQ